ncbi:hypothetical protein WN944_013929 [Citrus x changshan-huyou]|uniref:Uncharacterized protein n=1 Tax=Citrus x changshan-huyou TaxID=2935761 RepID=A0AAP0M4T9_9ROSI
MADIYRFQVCKDIKATQIIIKTFIDKVTNLQWRQKKGTYDFESVLYGITPHEKPPTDPSCSTNLVHTDGK